MESRDPVHTRIVTMGWGAFLKRSSSKARFYLQEIHQHGCCVCVCACVCVRM